MRGQFDRRSNYIDCGQPDDQVQLTRFLIIEIAVKAYEKLS